MKYTTTTKTVVKLSTEVPEEVKAPLKGTISRVFAFLKKAVILLYRLLVFIYKKGPLS